MLPLTSVATLALAGSPALAAITVDGTVDVDYGAPVAVQTVQTQFGDNFSEIDAAYAKVDAGTLYLTLTGNLENNFNKYTVFIDSVAGGQNSIDAVNNPQNFDSNIGAGFANGWDPLTNRGLADSPLQAQAGNFTFDAGFEADYALLFRRGAGKFDFDFAKMDQTAQDADEFVDVFFGFEEGASGPIVGPGSQVAPGNGSGETFEIAFDNSNVAGIAGGTAAADQAAAAAVSTGIELAIPLSAIGNPTGTIKVTALVNGSNADFLSNQLLGGFAAPQGNPGSDGNGNFLSADVNLDGVIDALDDTNGSGGPDPLGMGLVDLNNFAGDQFFEVVISSVAIDGDYNNNGLVEQGDLDLVLLNWGTSGTPAGWVNQVPVGLVDQAELDGVLLNWGNTAEPAGSAVPEPATAALLSLGGLAMLRRRVA